MDILLKGELEGVDVEEQFNGYDVGILGGEGFEVVRIGVELRGNWGLKSLVNDEGAFEMTDAKSFTLQIVGKIRFNRGAAAAPERRRTGPAALVGS